MKNLDRITYLESLLPKNRNIEDLYYPKFEKYSRYIGNGVYTWDGFYSPDTRVLFLMGCLRREKIKFKEI